MKKKKALAVLLLLISFICGGLTTYKLVDFDALYDGGFSITDFTQSKYENTYSFTYNVYDNVYSIFSAHTFEKKYIVNDSVNYDTVVLQTVANSGHITSYTLNDIIAEGVELGISLVNDSSSTPSHYLSDTYYNYYEYDTIKTIVYNITSQDFTEPYTTEFYDLDSSKTYTEKGYLEDCVYNILSSFAHDYSAYDSLKGDSNFYYTINYSTNDTHVEISNSNTSYNITDTSHLTYIYDSSTHQWSYTPSSESLKDNLINVTNNALDSIDTNAKLLSFSFSIDLGFAADDLFKEYNDSFESGKTLFAQNFFLILVAVICFIVGIILLFKACLSKKDGKVVLSFIDKIYTEVFFIGSIALMLIVIYVGSCIYHEFFYSYYYTYSSTHKIYFSLIIYAGIWFFGLIALVELISLIKRIMSHTFFSNFIISRMYISVKSKVMGLTNNKNIIFILLIPYIPVVLIQFFLLIAIVDMTYSMILGALFLILFMIVDVLSYIYFLKNTTERHYINNCLNKIAQGDTSFIINTNRLTGTNKTLANNINKISDGLKNAVDEAVKSERLKAELITNVSHDLKTPLTSIINYVDLLKREDIDNDNAKKYISVLESKSQRLKNLTEDLVEASKASTGNITLELSRINFVELINQLNGEFESKYSEKNLLIISEYPDDAIYVNADGRRMYRILDNLYNNAYKYSLTGTRVYINIEVANGCVYFIIKNISESPLNINPDELTKRFTRGDSSRSTEGSGLGLSIAKSLTLLHNGYFDIKIDGDLFTAIVGLVIVE